jgi:antagonist of KipI
VLGSRATHLGTRLGGYQGRKLIAGDVLGTCERDDKGRSRVRRELSRQRLPDFLSRREVRVLAGPQADFFSEHETQVFFRESYRVQPNSDRAAIRLDGNPLKHRESADIVSEPSPAGAVQVPAGGKPMILMADRPTAGGYPKIANVIAADLPTLAQLKPGDEIRFAPCGGDEALTALRQMEEALEAFGI